LLYAAYVPAAGAERASQQERRAHRIACIGRIVPIKGHDVLIEAVSRLRTDGNNDVECLILGDGPADYVQQLKAATANGPAASAIKWLGWRDDIVKILRGCAILACPSRREPLGRVILEAWDAGAVPVACAQAGGVAEVISAADGGILYDEQTPAALAAALASAMNLPRPAADRLVANGRDWMNRHCEPGRYAKAMSGILRDAVASHQVAQ
jgi:glycosyltransferase involved in cell wall biosynthesis